MLQPLSTIFAPQPVAAAAAPSTLSPELAQLSPEHRAEVWTTYETMLEIDQAYNKSEACKLIASTMHIERGWSYDNLRRKYYAWVAADRDWRALIDRAKAPLAAREVPRAKLDNLFRAYCEKHQRSNRSAWRALIRDIRRGVHFPGIGTWRDIWQMCYQGERPPAECPVGWIPPGMTYRNFQRYAAPTAYELTAMRIGPKAASRYIPGLYTTRAGLLPGMLYQFDDMWHDVEVAMPGYAQSLVRPQEFSCIDVASTHKIAYGLRPQVLRADGTRESLSELEMLWLVCHVLTEVGYHRDGSVWCVEHGTAAIRPAQRQIIARLTGGAIQYRDADILGKAIHAGMFDGTGKGNFRTKALIESSHRLLHYAAAMLPGQTGGNARVDRPEQLDGMEKWAKYVSKAWDSVPENLRERLFFGGISWSGYGRIIAGIYDEIYNRRDHEIEGFEANEWLETEWSLDGRGDWRSMRDIPALPPAVQHLALEASRQPGHTRVRRWSPVEVWQSGADQLTRIPIWGIADLLGMDRAKQVTVQTNHLIQFQDRFLGPGNHRYISVVECPDGSTQALTAGRQYALWVNPYQPDKALIACAENGKIIGMAPQWSAVNPLDTLSVQTMQAKQGMVKASLNAPIIARHTDAADDRLAAMQHTTTIIEQSAAPAPPPKRKRPMVAADPILSLTQHTHNYQEIHNEDW